MLLPGSRLENVEKSLNIYLEAQLVTLAGYTVLFPREGFGDTIPGQWVEINYLPMAEEYPTTFGALGWGSERQLIVNANCFEQQQEQIGQAGGLADQYSLTRLVDIVCDVLGPRAVIPIVDYEALGTPTVAHFGWRQIRKQRVPGNVTTGLEQWNVSTTLAYSEEHV